MVVANVWWLDELLRLEDDLPFWLSINEII